ncbi:MAG TPA: hypothetical protein VGB87_00390 [Vicinamibacteria bacterium]
MREKERALAVHLLVSSASSLLVPVVLRWIEARPAGAPARRASALLLLGLLPALGGLAAALGLARDWSAAGRPFSARVRALVAAHDARGRGGAPPRPERTGAPRREVALALLFPLALGAAGSSALRPVHGGLEALVHLPSLR